MQKIGSGEQVSLISVLEKSEIWENFFEYVVKMKNEYEI